MDPLPARIGRYVVESLVGVGGMGQIYKAHDPDIRRTVAIKLISTRLMSRADSADYIRRFRREAETAARCAHPNIITIYDFALHEGEPFLAMEFVYGMSLREALEEKSAMAVPDAIQVMLQVLDALDSAHEQGVIHQDIKPANIMLTPQMKAKVADFGISRFAHMDVTSASSSMGTPNYMSPEQCRGAAVGPRSDLFSAGATLFEMVAGAPAFAGANAAEVTYRIVNESLPALPAAVRSVAPRLQFVLERAMGKQPENRFESGHAMAEALRQVLGDPNGPETAEITRLSIAEAIAAIPTGPPVGQPDEPPGGSPAGPRAGPPVGSGSESSAGSPIGPPTDSSIPWPIEAGTLQMLEQKLASYVVGPIARIMVRAAAGRTSSLEALCAELAASLPEGAERERFRRDVAPLMPARRPPATDDVPSHGHQGHALPEPELERAQRAMTQYVGPIARVLVRQAAREAQSVDGLWQALATHIEQPAERAAFLRQRHDQRA
jgi:eukaryotic-like serine/threonine-protein kinase